MNEFADMQTHIQIMIECAVLLMYIYGILLNMQKYKCVYRAAKAYTEYEGACRTANTYTHYD